MPTYYTTIDDQFNDGSIDWGVWDDSSDVQVSETGGNLVVHTTGALYNEGFIRTNLTNTLDSTPIAPTVSGNDTVVEMKVKPLGQRPSSGSIYQYAFYTSTYHIDGSGNTRGAGFQIYARTGSGASTVYSLKTDERVNGYYTTTSPVLVNITVGSWLWLRMTVTGADKGYYLEYSTDGSTWYPANADSNFYTSSTGIKNFMGYETYNNAGVAADAYVDYVTYKTTQPPTVDFSASVTSGVPSLSVDFTDLSPGTFTSWSWDFGDTGTSTSQNPTHNYTTPGLYTVSLTATSAIGSNTETKTALINVLHDVEQGSTITSSPTVGTPVVTLTDPPPPAPADWSAVGTEDKKEYLYKVYDSADNYLGVWTDVSDQPRFTRRLNQPGTTMTVQLSRSANTTIEVRSSLLTEAGDTLITESSDTYVATSTTPNTVGEDTDVDLNYNVDIYVQYGGFENLVTQDGELMITEDSDQLVVTYGSPLGTRIFSGYIMDYTASYGEQDGVTVTLASHGMELSQDIIRSGSTTTVTYSTTEVATQVKNILDANPGKMTYDGNSIDNTGETPTLTYRLNTKLEGIESAFSQSPDGWYWFGGVADPLVWLKDKSATADHTFYLGHHIKDVQVKRSIESLTNAVWFVGAGDPPVYKYYEDATSQSTWRKGIYRITDARYSVTASMSARANKLIGRYKDPIFTTPLTISSGRYDIETIQLGQMIGFANFGNFIDTLLLQVVGLSYSPTEVTLELGELQDRQIDIIGDTAADLANAQYETLPSAPS